MAGCKSKQAPLANTNKKEIRALIKIGQSGGITGAIEQYTVDRTGLVKQWNTPSETPKTIGMLSKEACNRIFEQAEKLEKLEAFTSKPGNMNYWFSYSSPNGNLEVKWSDNQTPSKEIVEFYRTTFKALKSAKPNK